jgi:hypothetical protein
MKFMPIRNAGINLASPGGPMLKRFTIALVLSFVLATTAVAQVVMPGAQPNPDFPAPTGPGNPQDIPSVLAACNASVQHDQNGYPVRQLVRDCMYSKGYSVIYQNNCYQNFIPNQGWHNNTPKEVADCLSPPDNVPNNSYTFFPTGWQQRVPPVAFDPAAPGPKLLMLAKKLADNGQLDNLDSVAGILNLTLALDTHSESGPVSCAAVPPGDSGYNISDSYAITGNGWFHALPSGKTLLVNPERNDWMPRSPGPGPTSPHYVPLGAPVFSYQVGSGMSCPTPSPRDGVGAGVAFNNIPAYACISDALVRTIFPPGPADELGRTIDGPGPDFAYFHKDTRVFFSLTWPGREKSDPPNQPNCLLSISMGGHYPFGPLHKSDFNGKYPMPAKIAVPPKAANARMPSTTPGTYLLERVKALADNAQITDPVAASGTLHLPFVLNRYDVDETVSCAEFPGGWHRISENYDMANGGWFRALPTGKRLLFTSPVYDKDFYKIIGHTTFPLDNPNFGYGTDVQAHCTPPSERIDFGITFANIPAYACISPQQIKVVFPGMHVPTGAEASGLRPDFSYISAHSWVQFFMATNPAAVLTAPRLAPHQPNCLTLIQIYALLDLAEQKREYAQMTAAPPQAPPPPPRN